MEELGDRSPADHVSNYRRSWPEMSPEIVEIIEESSCRDINKNGKKDVYVAVGKDGLDVLKWVLNNQLVVSSSTRIFLVHVFPPLTYIPTPVGRLSRSQLTEEQVRVYVNEDNNRRRNILQKYIQLCNDAKVMVDTVLVESNSTAKAIIDLISILEITYLVMGSKRPPSSRLLMNGVGKGDFVKKNAPDFCEVAIVHKGEKRQEGRRRNSVDRRQQPERKFFDCISCFSGK
ncbi:U-box domain-containing protein 33-like [Impatiens glandulifera]|uniref:U-box domain-containing protein 33-like n=1 Tax=Impatiens glandulifera TaxID=253017 RepID=UPI001FB118FE|nr:U-box domain-containing protein 33-like [Impatiens glandulifera]